MPNNRSQWWLGSAGWSSKRLPVGLCLLYWATGTVSLFVYLLGLAVLLWVGMSLWQGIVLRKAGTASISDSKP